MREIKFRGKTKQGNWVYGVPVESRTNCGNWYIELVKTIDYETDLEYSTCVESEEIDENTLGQYTGLKDKNGKEIYEGDILEYEFEDIGKQKAYVNWNGKYSSFTLEVISEDFEYAPIESGVVIGNIHDNPELLEEMQCQDE